MIRREGAPACEPVGESWWCRLKERIDYLWDRASACILTINHKTPDGDGDFAVVNGEGIAVTDEDNGIRISATLTESIVEGMIGEEAQARQQADAALQQDITIEETARKQADNALQQDIDAEETARKQADQTLQADIDTRALQTALDAEESARQQADSALQAGKLDKDQGSGNAGKVLVVGGDGIIKPGTSSASVAWGGISGDLADQTDLSQAIGSKADSSALTAESNARQQADRALQAGKLDKDQGSGNAGKVLVVGGDGVVAPGNPSTGVAWGNISGDLADQTDLSQALDAKADESSVVKTTGDQTVAGVKSFTDVLKIRPSNWTPLQITNPSADTTTGTQSYGSAIRVLDANGIGMGQFYVIQKTEAGLPTSEIQISALQRNASESTVFGTIYIKVNKEGVAYATAPPTPSSANGTEIATAGWVNDRIDGKANISNVPRRVWSGNLTLRNNQLLSQATYFGGGSESGTLFMLTLYCSGNSAWENTCVTVPIEQHSGFTSVAEFTIPSDKGAPERGRFRLDWGHYPDLKIINVDAAQISSSGGTSWGDASGRFHLLQVTRINPA